MVAFLAPGPKNGFTPDARYTAVASSSFQPSRIGLGSMYGAFLPAGLGGALTGSEIGPLCVEAEAWAGLGVDGPCCWPAVAAAAGAREAERGPESSLAICPALTRTGLGTGYILGIEPSWA